MCLEPPLSDCRFVWYQNIRSTLHYVIVVDGQTDGQTDRQTSCSWHKRDMRLNFCRAKTQILVKKLDSLKDLVRMTPAKWQNYTSEDHKHDITLQHSTLIDVGMAMGC